MTNVTLSVVMAVYNGKEYLNEAIDSVLAQTFDDWEFIIVDDCSTDDTPRILSSYTDSRIKVIRNDKNCRLATSLNRGILQAKGTYIIRMDADDVCSLDRFEKQVAFMEKHPQITVSWGKGFRYQDGQIDKKIITLPRKDSDVKALFLFINPIFHNCCIIRRELFDSYRYQPQFTISEDLNLWLRAGSSFLFQGQNEYLILYRIHDAQATNSANQPEAQKQFFQNISQCFNRCGIHATKEEIAFHTQLVYQKNMVDIAKLMPWFLKLKTENRKTKSYKKTTFHYALLWKTAELRREKRLSWINCMQLSMRISPVGMAYLYFHKIVYAITDCFAKTRSRFPKNV